MKKQEKMEKAEKDRKGREEHQKAIEDEVILNEKEQLRLELERMKEGRVASEASEGKNDETRGVEQRGTEEEEIRHNDLTEVTFADYIV